MAGGSFPMNRDQFAQQFEGIGKHDLSTEPSSPEWLVQESLVDPEPLWVELQTTQAELRRQSRTAEAALKRESTFIDTILDTLQALVVVLDREGRIVRFSRACEQLTGAGGTGRGCLRGDPPSRGGGTRRSDGDV
jgi:PAS domain-containing protein